MERSKESECVWLTDEQREHGWKHSIVQPTACFLRHPRRHALLYFETRTDNGQGTVSSPLHGSVHHANQLSHKVIVRVGQLQCKNHVLLQLASNHNRLVMASTYEERFDLTGKRNKQGVRRRHPYEHSSLKFFRLRGRSAEDEHRRNGQCQDGPSKNKAITGNTSTNNTNQYPNDSNCKLLHCASGNAQV